MIEHEETMGDYIRTVVETRGPSGWRESEAAVFTNDPTWPGHDSSEFTRYAFFWQNYTMYSLFADVRTREHGITPVAPDRGLPDDASDDALQHILGGWGGHGWFQSDDDCKTVAQKVASRNDDQTFGLSWLSAAELRAVDYDALITTRDDPVETMPLKDALGKRYFEHLAQLAKLGSPENVRILFCFSQ